MNADKLSHEKIQQLLAAVGMRAKDDAAPAEDVQEYDWRQPRYFKLEQLGRIEAFAESAANQLLEEMKRLYRQDCTVSMVSAQQSYQNESEGEDQKVNYYLAFGREAEKPFGIIAVPNASALFWTGQILGDTGSDKESERILSSLEESLLLDIVSGLINAFSGAWGKSLHLVGQPSTDRSSFELDGSDERFEIVYEIKSEESGVTARVTFLLCCDRLASIAGSGSVRQEKFSDAQIRNMVMEHLHHVGVDVRVELGKMMLAFGDVMNLAVDDVVVLNKKVTDSVDVVVEDRTLFRGRPARSSGHHAVVIL